MTTDQTTPTTQRLMDGVWDLRFTPEIPDDDAFGHGSDFWDECYRVFVYSTDEYPDQAERVGPTDRFAVGIVHQDGDTVHGRDWDGRAVILVQRPVTFEVGGTYEARSAGDYDCIWRFRVVKRTAKFITIRERDTGEQRRVGVRLWTFGGRTVEHANPLGNYSLAPILSADKVAA